MSLALKLNSSSAAALQLGGRYVFRRSMTDNSKPIGIYYEHPDWFRPLFAELDKRGIPYKKIDASCHGYKPGETESQFSLVFNRMSASAYTRGHGNTTFYTRNYLAHLERKGVRVINGGE